ncbi:hypothetical protein HB780_08105 (plasmid) [Rhizobium lusitanum]|uniref:hypothetical protein n=1 Tax=Rhizobium lusitanum TaxID=293958 RepID=UPI00161F23DF|nr:hypothetical protein [Rhizobium lusitanum]QND45687.1 hypothetical protein HB780_08105 [Rhizobium lusitanum]
MTQKANDIPIVTMETACGPLPDPQPESGCAIYKYRILFAFYEVEIYAESNFGEPYLRISGHVPSWHIVRLRHTIDQTCHGGNHDGRLASTRFQGNVAPPLRHAKIPRQMAGGSNRLSLRKRRSLATRLPVT